MMESLRRAQRERERNWRVIARMPSSVLRRYAYDSAAQRLDIEFVSGRRYSYHDVPERIWNRLLAATSKGSFFTRRIRDHFRFTRVG